MRADMELSSRTIIMLILFIVIIVIIIGLGIMLSRHSTETVTNLTNIADSFAPIGVS